jgi:hypothetical protein
MDRVVWLEILKRACDDINMPISAFPHSAFSSRDIELFATAWIRFQKVLRNVEDGKRAPEKMVRIVDIHSPLHSFAQSTDGRFLFVAHSAGLQVWSLQTQTPTLVNFFEIELPDECWSRLHANIETNHSFFVYLLVIGRSQL